MPTVIPFRAWRYAPDTDLSAVTAPPYDVLSADDVAMFQARHERNIVHVDVPPQTPEGYADAAATLKDWMAAGTLVQDDAPTFTLYRMSFKDACDTFRNMIGVLVGLPVDDYGKSGVLPHERITPKASTDRLDLTRATGANLSPIWALSLVDGLSNVLEQYWDLAASAHIPTARCTDAGVTHETLPIANTQQQAVITSLIAQSDVLIADGHHRYGVAQRYREEVREDTDGPRPKDCDGPHSENCDSAHPEDCDGPHPEDFTLAFISELVAEQLNIDAIHRVYDGVDFDTLKAALATHFDLEPAPKPTPATLDEMVAEGRLVLLSPAGDANWLTPKPGIFDDVRPLDGLWLEQALADVEALTVTYQHGLEETLATVPEHSGAVLIRPTSIEEIRRTATEGLLMPPKSTFFTPKLRTGLVLRTLDE